MSLALYCWVLSLTLSWAQTPPLPSVVRPPTKPRRVIQFDSAKPLPPPVVRRPGTIIPPRPIVRSGPVQAHQPVPVATQPSTALRWDQETKEFTPKPGEMSAPFTFWVTNVHDSEVIISGVKASCGCTKPVLPETPWKLSPGESGSMDVSVNLSGKSGTITKYLTVTSTAGQKILYVKVHIPSQGTAGNQLERLQRMQQAMNNKQAVFSGTCVECHVTPGVGKMGQDLYAASCGICHDAEHRAAMVPDLATVKKENSEEYWRQWITNGRGLENEPSPLMPAFGGAHRGPLTDQQIESLVKYLVEWKTGLAGGSASGGGAAEDVTFLKLPE